MRSFPKHDARSSLLDVYVFACVDINVGRRPHTQRVSSHTRVYECALRETFTLLVHDSYENNLRPARSSANFMTRETLVRRFLFPRLREFRSIQWNVNERKP